MLGGVVMRNNVAGSGGALYADNSEGTSGLLLVLHDGELMDNTAEVVGEGEPENRLVALHADSGGAVFAHAAYVLVSATRLGGNTAGKGGGIYWEAQQGRVLGSLGAPRGVLSGDGMDLRRVLQCADVLEFALEE